MGSPSAPHNFSGFLPEVHIFGEITFPTYFLVVSISFCFCLFWLVRRTDQRALSRNAGLDLALVLMVFGFLGARLFHIFFEEPAYYWQSWGRIFEIWRGGFVWYGGALLGTFGFWLYMKRRHLPKGIWLDIFAPICALGYGLGRVACLLTGCCFGGVCELPSGYSFLYPTQAFAVIWEFAVLALILFLEKRRRSSGTLLKKDGAMFAIWVGLHSVGRIIMEAFRADPRGPAILNLSVSTWISLALIAAALWLGYFRHLRQRKSTH